MTDDPRWISHPAEIAAEARRFTDRLLGVIYKHHPGWDGDDHPWEDEEEPMPDHGHDYGGALERCEDSDDRRDYRAERRQQRRRESEMPKASAMWSESPTLRVLIYGPNGSGKTVFGARSPSPLIILTEPSGLPNIVAKNPDAHIIPAYTYESFSMVVRSLKQTAVSSDDDSVLCDATITYLDERGREVVEEASFSTLVLDSLTEMQNLAMSKYTDDGEKRPNQDIWWSIKRDTKRLMSILRGLPCHLLAICLSAEHTDDLDVRRVSPQVFGSLRQELGQYFNAIGYLQKGSKEFGGIRWHLGSRYITKRPAGPWPTASVLSDDPGRVTLGSLLAYHAAGSPPLYDLAEGDSADHLKPESSDE